MGLLGWQDYSDPWKCSSKRLCLQYPAELEVHMPTDPRQTWVKVQWYHSGKDIAEKAPDV